MIESQSYDSPCCTTELENMKNGRDKRKIQDCDGVLGFWDLGLYDSMKHSSCDSNRIHMYVQVKCDGSSNILYTEKKVKLSMHMNKNKISDFINSLKPMSDI